MTALGRPICLLALVCLAAPVARSAPAAMTRDEIVTLARSGVDYSYWWGHGRWRADGAQLGSCSGSCPDCTHSGSYGADCSGFAAKVWQVPGPSAVSTDAHPYSTYNFRYESQHWSQVSRSNTLRADALVYRNDANTGGHIVVFDSGDPWGQAWVWEARGCSYGIVHNLRSIGSTYVTIRRDNLSTGPATGTLIGSVYVDQGDGNMDQRIPGATVSASGQSTTARADDAIWSFSLPVGNHTAAASASGYASKSRTCEVTAGGTTWCSIGLTAVCVPNCAGKNCGSDGCGGSCGSCPDGHTCNSGQCACQPQCAGIQCGSDGCGGSCGSCPNGHTCSSGQCVCQPQCAGVQCGPDPICGESCGNCPQGQECSGQGTCEPTACQPKCGDRLCGPDPVCGQSCGDCPPGQVCSPEGACLDDGCQPECAALACGADLACGRSCGVCQPDRICSRAGLCDRIDPSQGKLFGTVRERLSEDSTEDEAAGTFVGHARVWLDDGQEIQADENGYWELATAPGEFLVQAEAQGFDNDQALCAVESGGYAECHLGLFHSGTPRDEEPIEILGGCASVPFEPAGALPVLLGLLGWALARRRR